MTEKYSKALVSQIDLGFAKFNGLMIPDGRYAIAVPQIAELFGLQKSQASRCIKRLLNDNVYFVKIRSEISPKPVNVVLIEDLEKITLNFALQGNEKAIALWNKMSPNKPIIQRKKKKIERKQGYIYLFEGINVLKLGFSTDVETRLKTLSRWEDELEIIAKKKGTITKEKSIHSILHQTGDYFGDEWYPLYRKHEILQLMDVTISCNELVRKALETF
jgi:predicted transcriptional regulator